MASASSGFPRRDIRNRKTGTGNPNPYPNPTLSRPECIPYPRGPRPLDASYSSLHLSIMARSVKLTRGPALSGSPSLQSNVLNLSRVVVLLPEETSVLERGLLFVPTPTTIAGPLLEKDLLLFHRRLHLHEYFFGAETPAKAPFYLPSMWELELS